MDNSQLTTIPYPLKDGYKQTEVGVIPEDWEVTTLGVVAETSSGTTPSRALMERYYRNGAVAWVKTLDLNDSDINSTDESVTELALKETCLRPYPIGTVLVAMYGGFNQIGRTGLLRIPAAVNQAITAILPKKGVLVSEYLICNLNHRADYWKRVASSSRKDPNITSRDIRDFPIACPKPQEQEAIAEALSDADALIESLEKLVAKKRHIKQGTMQQLLTGKKRLRKTMDSGELIVDNEGNPVYFSGEWEVKRIGDVLTIAHGKSQHVVEDRNGIYPILATGGRIGTANRFLYDKPSVLIGRKGTIDRPQYMDQPFWTVDTLFYSVIYEPNNAKYLFYQFCLIDWKQHNEASGVPSLNARTIERIELNVPPPEEQTAIAAVLSDMDAEIAALETRLTKTRSLKQGMMHELLTGRIRLV